MMTSQPKRASGTHVERTESFSLPASVDAVFPLLCPVREYEWIPGWSCDMVHSQSGFAEKGAVFATKARPFGKMLWTCTWHEPPRRVEYLLTVGADVSDLLEIALDPTSDGCVLTWSMKATTRSTFRGRAIGRQMTEGNFRALICRLEKQLREYLLTR